MTTGNPDELQILDTTNKDYTYRNNPITSINARSNA